MKNQFKVLVFVAIILITLTVCVVSAIGVNTILGAANAAPMSLAMIAVLFRPNPTPPPFVPPVVTDRYLTFTAEEDNVKVGFVYFSEDYQTQDAGLNIEYSLDNGVTFLPYQIALSEEEAFLITLNQGQSVKFRGMNDNLSFYLEDEDDYQYLKCVLQGTCKASGDVTSLLNKIGGNIDIQQYCFCNMFYACTSLMQAPSLPSTTLDAYCYSKMFQGCTSLTQAPSLPATTLAEYCYSEMFQGCTSLTQAPSLPATTLAEYCYSELFKGCTSLTQAPSLPATILATNCYYELFSECTSLTQAPSLPATILATNCYNKMFQGCTSLTQAPSLPATTLAGYCYSAMFLGCTSLNYVKAMFLTSPSNSYTNNWLLNVAATGTFVKNSQASWDVTGANGIPSGWQVETADN